MIMDSKFLGGQSMQDNELLAEYVLFLEVIFYQWPGGVIDTLLVTGHNVETF